MAEEPKKEQQQPKAAVKKEGIQRRPSALKRDLQSKRGAQRNRSYRAKVSTAIRNFEQSLTQKEPAESLKSKLNLIFSLMDKGVKKGIYKTNKASRTKSRLAARSA
jgi:small subunit ribosomal protein S20